MAAEGLVGGVTGFVQSIFKYIVWAAIIFCCWVAYVRIRAARGGSSG